MKKQYRLFYGSSYDRGLSFLLFMWPDIKKAIPEAELNIAYGWDLYLLSHHNNPERMKWKEGIDTLMKQEGIIHHGRLGKDKLRELRLKCGIWAYPTNFDEINCITAIECQKDGLVPVVINRAALKEVVQSGIKVEGKIEDMDVQDAYRAALIELMQDDKRWKAEEKNARSVVEKYSIEKIAKEWVKVFSEGIPEPLVTVVTPTIREGWWEMMYHTLKRQTYKNFEWLIVDDHKEDRSDIAKGFDLPIRYIRGDKATGSYTKKHALARANNIALREANGELLVFLQDFIAIPEHGIEWLVNVYQDHPDALIAPVDEYYFAQKPDTSNEVDWWPGELDIYTGMAWRNVRQTFEGVRETDNPQDFEMNYCAVPTKIAKKLNGWYEFFDDQMGFDNTEFAYRALQLGYKIIIDDTNVARCIEAEGQNGRSTINRDYWDHFINKEYPPIRDERKDIF